MDGRSGASSESSAHPILSFSPLPQQLAYPHLPPGNYVFTQDKISKEVFLWPSQSGHGHPFLAQRVNKIFKRKADDYSWLDTAGEILIGYEGEILGLSCCTGYFHKTLGLTEPQPGTASAEAETSRQEYLSYIRAKMQANRLPPQCYFLVGEWEQFILTSHNRNRLLRATGAFQIGSDLVFQHTPPENSVVRGNNLYLYLDQGQLCYATRSGKKVIRTTLEAQDENPDKDKVENGLEAAHFKTLTEALRNKQDPEDLSEHCKQAVLNIASKRHHSHAKTKIENLKEIQYALRLNDSSLTYPAAIRILLEKIWITLQYLSFGGPAKHALTQANLSACHSTFFHRPLEGSAATASLAKDELSHSFSAFELKEKGETGEAIAPKETLTERVEKKSSGSALGLGLFQSEPPNTAAAIFVKPGTEPLLRRQLSPHSN